MLSASPDVLMRVARYVRPRHMYNVICASKKTKQIFDSDEYWCRHAIFCVGRHLVPKLKYYRRFPDLNFSFDLIDISGDYAEKIDFIVESCHSKVLSRQHFVPDECDAELKYDGGDRRCLARILCGMHYIQLCDGLPPQDGEELLEREKEALHLYGKPPASMKEIVWRETMVDNVNVRERRYYDLYVMRKFCRDIDDYFGADVELKRKYLRAFMRGLEDCRLALNSLPRIRTLKIRYVLRVFKSSKGFEPVPLYRHMYKISDDRKQDVIRKFWVFFVAMKDDRPLHDLDYRLLYNFVGDIFNLNNGLHARAYPCSY